MLIISRRVGERVLVGDNVRIEVIEISGQTVRIGVDAPREVRVYRQELWDAVCKENLEAARNSPAKFPQLPQDRP